jgi:hypothetical protein
VEDLASLIVTTAGTGTVRLRASKRARGTTNRTNVRMEGHAAFGVERQNAAVRIAAA